MDLIDQLVKMQRPSSVQSDRRKIAHATAKLKRDIADGEEVYRRPLHEVRSPDLSLSPKRKIAKSARFDNAQSIDQAERSSNVTGPVGKEMRRRKNLQRW